jgi:hypothetical protein
MWREETVQNLADNSIGLQTKTYRYKIEQTAKGARITVHGDAIDEVVADYTRLRIRLEQEGFKISPEE